MRYVYLILVTWSILIVGYFYFDPFDQLRPAEIPKSPPIVEKKLGIEFQASEEMHKIFPQLAAMQKEGIPLKDQFNRMGLASDSVCNMIHGNYPENKALFKQFSAHLANNPGGLTRIIAGCWNFFTMNDVKIVKLIDKLNHLYPHEDKICYSVGFSQIYILSSKISCKEITAIDIDWRILWGHYQVMDSLVNTGQLDFKTLNIGWSVDFVGKPRPLEPNVSIKTFCYASDWNICSDAFESFGKTKFDHLELQLAYLHQIKLKPTSSHVLIYVSNAIDPGYTSKAQFDELMAVIREYISFSQKLIFVYHAGGEESFGIYEVRRYHPNGDIQITTVCADNYKWAGAYSSRGQKYKTYLDEVSITNESPVCSQNP